jgi:hypothetical protein
MRSATCQTSFTINPLPMHPPTLTVSASPASLMCGDPSTITAVGSSPDNSPLTYQCAATAGQLTGNGPKYTLDTVGVAVSTIGVNCTITDARNLTASGSTSVRCSAVQQAAQAHKFGRIDFKNVGNPAWLDNEARVELDRYADALAADPDAMGVVVGHVKAKENRAKSGSKDSPRFAAKRAINTKGYLVIEKGIDPARIRARTGSGDGPRVDLWIVPAGASFPDQGTVAIK